MTDASASSTNSLVSFVQTQFKRVIWWCWETVIEEIATHESITLDHDRLLYTGAELRTGPFAFTRNNASWNALCSRVANSDSTAMQIITEVKRLLVDGSSRGRAASWLAFVQSRANRNSVHSEHSRRILQSPLTPYDKAAGPSIQSSTEDTIVYALWRLDSIGNLAIPVPLYIGKTRAFHRRISGNKGHEGWWGQGKPIGVNFCVVDKRVQTAVEKRIIDDLVPFCNTNGNRLRQLWGAPRA